MREHGYKGAFEMAASVDYLFAYDATTNLVERLSICLSDRCFSTKQRKPRISSNR